MSRATIIITSYNGHDLLATNLPSVLAAINHANVEHEVIVVDNGSTDNSSRMLKQEFPSVKLIREERNLGFIKASNKAARLAETEFLVMLNNDMELDRNYFKPLLEHFNDPEVFAVTPKVYFADRSSLNAGLKYGYLKQGSFSEVLQTDESKLQQASLTLYAHGGSAAFRRSLFLELGGFDELYSPFYQEALDLSYRAYKRGFKVIFEPGSLAYHQHRSTVNRLYSSAQIDRVLLRNQLLFFWTNITDPLAFSEHLNYLARQLGKALWEGDSLFISAFLLALMNLRQVIARQRQRSPHWVRSDREVLELIRG